MSLTIKTGITLILSTLIYHSGLVLLFTRAQFGEAMMYMTDVTGMNLE